MDTSVIESLSTHGEAANGGAELDASFKQEPATSKNSGLMARLFPTGFKFEFIELIKYSWPIAFTQFFSSFIRVTTIIFVGHLGKMQLSGATLGVSLVNLIGNSISNGLIAVCDTYFSQSFGSPNKYQVGIYLQTALYVASLCCIVSCALLINVRNIMLLLGQDPIVSKYTEQFVVISLPALFFVVIYKLCTRYLMSQGIVIPCVLVGLIATILHVIVQYVLTYVVELGLVGSITASDIAYLSMAMGAFLYICISKVYKTTWSGWSKFALEDWGGFLKLGVFSIMMISIEWWTFEISFFLMGLLGPVEIGASSILYQIWSFYSSFSKGFGAACAYRVGRYLGASRIKGAVTAARVAIALAYMMSILMATITLALRYQLPLAFSSDKDVITLARNMLPILAVFSFFGSAKSICGGIVRGLGRQKLGGFVTLFAFGGLALPIGIPLMFYTSLGASGFWWGLNIGLAVASTSFIAIVVKVNWQKEVDKALERAKVTRKKRNKLACSISNVNNVEQLIYQSVLRITGSHRNVENSYGSVELECVAAISRSPTYWHCLVIKRTITLILCLATLGFGFVCRFVLFPPPSVITPNNGTTTNSTSDILL